jgi:uncharacterized membrane protein
MDILHKGFGQQIVNKPQANLPNLNQPNPTPGANPLLSLVLRGGVILSSLLIALGLVLFIVTGHSGYAADVTSASNSNASEAQSFTDYHASDSSQVDLYFPTNPLEVWQGLLSLKPFAMIMLGLMLLIATPVLNVALASYNFSRQGNRAFTGIGVFILAVLLVSFWLGKAGG